jgi:gamma-glutamyltranspeptidase/glutathione hydrolase
VLRRSDRSTFAELHRVFAKPGGGLWRAGDRLVQPDLAATLEAIAARGPDGFYSGPVADRIVAEMERGGGLISKDDLASYRAVAREPVRGSYRGLAVLSSPPSSSGGTTLVETLNILENFDLRAKGRWSAECLSLMAEAMKRSYRDRALHLADPDRVAIPAELTEKGYARRLAEGIRPGKPTPSLDLGGEVPVFDESEHTTHLSVVDADRAAVSFTTTLENLYGGRVVVRGAGFLLNDEMNDFNWVPGVTDRHGRIGTAPNRVEPGKRMLSSMCPTVVLREGRPWLITGSPGGRTIINTVLGIVVNVVDFGMSPRAAVDAPRLHHQWLPDRVRVEHALARDHPEVVRRLRAMGYAFEERSTQGDAHTILVDPTTGEILAVADKRVSGKASGY